MCIRDRKVPEKTANEARTRDGISHFQPYGKPKMREWIQFDFDSEEDLNRYGDLIDTAMRYADIRKRRE